MADHGTKTRQNTTHINVPVTLVTGFLDSGKTTAIQQIIGHGFGIQGSRTLIIDMEQEGETHYEQAFVDLHDLIIVDADNPSLLNSEYFGWLDDTYYPTQVFIEYNGMFRVQALDGIDWPKGWKIERQLTVLDGAFYHVYRKRQREQLRDMTQKSNVVLFNRCRDEADMLRTYAEEIHEVNPAAQVTFEGEDGKLIQL